MALRRRPRPQAYYGPRTQRQPTSRWSPRVNTLTPLAAAAQPFAATAPVTATATLILEAAKVSVLVSSPDQEFPNNGHAIRPLAIGVY